MKFKIALIISIILHISIFAIAIYVPSSAKSNETVYYVDLIHSPGGTGINGFNRTVGNRTVKNKGKKTEATVVEESQAGVKDLTVKKETKSKLRYPDKKGKKIVEKKELISVVRKSRTRTIKRNPSMVKTDSNRSGVVSTGISTGNGSGFGDGFGDGVGGIGSSFPYSYYIDTLRTKISSAWYSSLVSPGLKGKFFTVVYFKIFRNGKIGDLKIERKSGIVSLDLSALRAVENASPFAPLPDDFYSKFLIVHFKFEWEK
jgi:TonB family protein